MIAVFDTNVLIAAIITEGICSKLLRRARTAEITLISCPFIMEELRRTPSRKFRLSHDELSAATAVVREAIFQVIEHDIKITGICCDADDDNVLACAVAAKADYLVTGDSDLLGIKKFHGVKIITPRDFEATFP